MRKQSSLVSRRKLGISRMASLGFGLELDTSALDRWATLAKGAALQFGPEVRGLAFGIACSFRAQRLHT